MDNLLERLTRAYGPSSNEKQAAAIIEDEIKPYVDEIKRDDMGNLLALKKGGNKKILISTPMDQFGFLLTHIEDNGHIRFSNLSPINAIDILNSNVLYENGVVGVIKSEECKSDMVLRNLYIDIGEKDAVGVKERLSLGSCAVLKGDYYENDYMVMSPGLDGRAGCMCLIDLIKNLPENLGADIYFLFSVQGKIEARGNKVTAQCINPDIAISIDSASCREYDYSGKGPVLRLRDKNMISSNKLIKYIKNIADAYKLPLQQQVAVDDISDVDGVITAGIDAEVISIALPIKNYNSSSEILYKRDIEGLKKILMDFVKVTSHR